jgi:undecaprenyl-diphosphatase
MSPFQALILGVVEGLTEFLPVSSTGHLILTSYLLGIGGESVKTFEIVIQAGALLAVLGLYRKYVFSMIKGMFGIDRQGLGLFLKLTISFLPAAFFGLILHQHIKRLLFGVGPVIFALGVGGLVMILFDRKLRAMSSNTRTLDSVTYKEALIIGLGQCFSLWPGTSRAMATILSAMALRLPPKVAAEYSFLLALPTLGMATLFDAVRGGSAFFEEIGFLSFIFGFISSAIVAALAIRGFLGYLNRKGLAPFGWYRLFLSVAMLLFLLF